MTGINFGRRARGAEGVVVLPAWRAAMSDWQWLELSGTTMSGTNPASPPTGYTASARIDAWCGLAADRVLSRLIAGPGQGHTDGSGNDVLALSLAVNTPGAWQFLRQPSATADVVNIASGGTHYADGRHPASHSYYTGHCVPALGKFIKVGAPFCWQDAQSSPQLYGFDLTTNDWDGAGTVPNTSWPSAGVSNPNGGQCQDYSTGDIYYPGPSGGGLRRFNAADGSVTTLASISGVNADYCTDRPWAYDTLRGRLVTFGDAYLSGTQGRVWTNDGGSGSWSTITFTGSQASAFSGATKFGAEYVATLDRFLVKTATAGTVLTVHPTTWAVEVQSTSGGISIVNATNGPYSRFRELPAVRAALYYPAYTSQVWALALPAS